MKRLSFLLLLVVCATFHSLAGFLSYSTDYKIYKLHGTCMIFDSEESRDIGKGEITIYVRGGILYYTLKGTDNNVYVKQSINLTYGSAKAETLTLSSDRDIMLYMFKQGSNCLAFFNNLNVSNFVIKDKGTTYDVSAAIQYYDFDGDLVKGDDGAIYRTGDEVNFWFSGLFMAKNLLGTP